MNCLLYEICLSSDILHHEKSFVTIIRLNVEVLLINIGIHAGMYFRYSCIQVHISTALPKPGEEIKFWERRVNGERQEVSWIKEIGKPFFEDIKAENQTFVAFFKDSILYEIIGCYSTESMNRMNCMWHNLRNNPTKTEDKRRTVLDVLSLQKSASDVQSLSNAQKKILSFHTTIRFKLYLYSGITRMLYCCNSDSLERNRSHLLIPTIIPGSWIRIYKSDS